MTFLNGTLAQLNQEKAYHEQQVEALENHIDNLKVAQEYGEIATASVTEAIENIEPEHLELLKEHLLSLFSGEIETPSYTYPQDIVEPTPEAEEGVTEELDDSTVEQEITTDIFYDGTKSICYIGFTAKGRANNYGNHLTRVLDNEFPELVGKTSFLGEAYRVLPDDIRYDF